MSYPYRYVQIRGHDLKQWATWMSGDSIEALIPYIERGKREYPQYEYRITTIDGVVVKH